MSLRTEVLRLIPRHESPRPPQEAPGLAVADGVQSLPDDCAPWTTPQP